MAAAQHSTRGERLAHLLGVQDAGRALRDFATYLPTRAIPAIAGFIVLPILARKLSPTSLGVLSIDQTLITLGWTVIGSWLTAAIVRELPAHRLSGDLAGFERTLRRAVGLIGVGLLVFAAVLLGLGAFSSAIGHYLPYVIAAALGLVLQNISVSLFAAGLRPGAYAAVEVTARVGGIAIGVVLVFAGHGVAGYLLGLAIASTAAGVPGLFAAWPRPAGTRTPGPTSVRTWLAYGLPASSGAIADWALQFVDRYIIAVLRDTGAVGVYTVGNIVGDRIVSIPLAAFTVGAAPALLTAFERHGRDEVERLMRAYTRVMLLIGLPAVAYIGAVSGRLVPALTGGGGYEKAVPVAPIVALGALLYSLSAVAATGLSVAKHTRPLLYASSIGLAVNIGANFALIPPFGVMGAAVATPIGTAAVTVAVYLWARRHMTWRFPVGTLLRGCAAAGAGYAAAVEMTHVTGGAAADLVSAAVVGGVVYLALIVLLGERRSALRA